ncbi:hypothetical protein [Terrarubrum flagellatum]|uniref:hypothetical protein n=1 Tax=Terrirubrum flagellatum TaxID=2895980 RepID=UPI0031453484
MNGVRRKSSLFAAIALGGLFSLVSGYAAAECKTGPLRPLYQGETLTRAVQIWKGRTCVHFFNAFGGTTPLRSGQITQNPGHGVLQKTGLTRFSYAAAAGYKGGDSYAVRVCRGDGSACTNVVYDVTIQ